MVELRVVALSSQWLVIGLSILVGAAVFLVAADVLRYVKTWLRPPVTFDEIRQRHPFFTMATAEGNDTLMARIDDDARVEEIADLARFSHRLYVLERWVSGLRLFGHLGILYVAVVLLWCIAGRFTTLVTHLA